MKTKETQRSLKELWHQKKQCSGEEVDVSEVELSDEHGLCEETERREETASVTEEEKCMNPCCSEERNAYQPKGKATLSLFTKSDRKFLPSWYDKHEWLTLCTTKKKVFCVCCRYAQRHGLLTFSKKGEQAFTLNGFDNYKKAMEKFRAHEKSDMHLESELKWNALGNP